MSTITNSDEMINKVKDLAKVKRWTLNQTIACFCRAIPVDLLDRVFNQLKEMR